MVAPCSVMVSFFARGAVGTSGIRHQIMTRSESKTRPYFRDVGRHEKRIPRSKIPRRAGRSFRVVRHGEASGVLYFLRRDFLPVEPAMPLCSFVERIRLLGREEDAGSSQPKSHFQSPLHQGG